MSEYDETEDQETPQAPPPHPAWSLKSKDLAGCVLATAGNVLGALGAGFHMLAREFFAAASDERNFDEEIQEKVKLSEDLYDGLARLGDGS